MIFVSTSVEVSPVHILTIKEAKVERDSTYLTFDMDGAVLKVNSIELQQMLGCTAKSQRWVCSI